jgi:VWFA-related protein
MFFMRALLFLVFAVPVAAAQDPAPVFRTGATQVRLDVQVLDNNRPVAGLQKEDFLVWDEDQPQNIDFLGRESVPLQLLLVLDTSGSMTKLLTGMAAAARQALGALEPADQVGILAFAGRSQVLLEFTPDRPAAARQLQEAVQDASTGAGTTINAALLDAAGYFRQSAGPAARHAILILTDNGSLSYRISDDDVLKALAGVDAVLDAIVPTQVKPPQGPPGRNPDFTPHNVFKLAALTGGEVLRAGTGADRFREALERIRSRYSLAYKAPPSEPRSYRRIKVDLSPAARKRYPNAVVLTRAGYFVP